MLHGATDRDNSPKCLNGTNLNGDYLPDLVSNTVDNTNPVTPRNDSNHVAHDIKQTNNHAEGGVLDPFSSPIPCDIAEEMQITRKVYNTTEDEDDAIDAILSLDGEDNSKLQPIGKKQLIPYLFK